MMDRVAANPGRMRITPESGDPAFYATLEMADNPSVVGTPLNKANLLTDETATAIGLNSSATPNMAFSYLNSTVKSSKSSADTSFSNMAWKQIGTADLANLTLSSAKKATFTINLAKSISSLSEMIITCEDFVVSTSSYGGNFWCTITFEDTFSTDTDETISFHGSPSAGVYANPGGSRGQGAAHLLFGLDRGPFFASYCSTYSNGAELEDSGSLPLTAILSDQTINGTVSAYPGGGVLNTVSSGTIKVYGRSNP